MSYETQRDRILVFLTKIIDMPDFAFRVSAFVKLGSYLRSLNSSNQLAVADKNIKEKLDSLEEIIQDLYHFNGWFTEANVRQMLVAMGNSLEEPKLLKWLSNYQPQIEAIKVEKAVAVVLAGNIPAVGFHDFLSVLMSGNKLLAKLSSNDQKLLPAIAELLLAIEPRFESLITFTKETLKNFDAVIATGSNNSSRYFDYYFGKYPHIIRQNRNGVALLSGKETTSDFEGLADDIFSYFGLGCRNVSKIFVPEGYDFSSLLQVFTEKQSIIENSKYFNNYEYNKALFLVNSQPHFDTGNVLLVEEEQIASPVSVVNYEYYQDEQTLKKLFNQNKAQIQCVVSDGGSYGNSILFGKSQQPELWDYADGVDTMQFLLSLK